jgi:hypothetical protein
MHDPSLRYSLRKTRLKFSLIDRKRQEFNVGGGSALASSAISGSSATYLVYKVTLFISLTKSSAAIEAGFHAYVYISLKMRSAASNAEAKRDKVQRPWSSCLKSKRRKRMKIHDRRLYIPYLSKPTTVCDRALPFDDVPPPANPIWILWTRWRPLQDDRVIKHRMSKKRGREINSQNNSR